MILPKHEIEKRKLVTGFLSESQFQPCGVDLTLKEAFELTSAGAIDHDNSQRKLSETRPIPFEGEWLRLGPGAYKIIYNEIISIPPDCAGLAFPRSSLLRCGCDVHCAVWDPGYTGRSESLLVVENPHGVKLKRGARLVQLVFFRLTERAREVYAGRFNNENLE
ncbi:MAG: deoxyuridine 5'-triphosphate nucleotidohydrolase [Candidatus Micrarchaeia archaeon]